MNSIVVQDWFRRKSRLVSTLSHPFLSEYVGPERPRGYGFQCGSDHFTIFIDVDKVHFRVDSRQWPAFQGVLEARYHRAFFFEVFTLRFRQRTKLRRLYNRFDVFSNLLGDPTYDKLDESFSYPLEWCSKLLNDKDRITYFLNQWDNNPNSEK